MTKATKAASKSATKTDYILGMLSKIRHKRWEHYVVNRLIHRLADPEIEFVCQQAVRRPSGPKFLDLYFPQFKTYLEVDETHHFRKTDEASGNGTIENAADEARRRDIVDSAGLKEWRLQVFDEHGVDLPIEKVDRKVDDCVARLKALKTEMGDEFKRWDYERQYDPDTYKGKTIHVRDAVAFRTQRDAARCFGRTAAGHIWRGSWRVPKTNQLVWFPKENGNRDWENAISDDGTKITETYKGDDPKHLWRHKSYTEEFRIVFPHGRDALGFVLYRFLGVFELQPKECDERKAVFERKSDCVNLKDFAAS